MSTAPHPKNPTRLIDWPFTCKDRGNDQLFPFHHRDLWFSRVEDKCRFDILSSSPQDSINGHGYSLIWYRSEEHTSELQSPDHLVCRLLLEKKKKIYRI